MYPPAFFSISAYYGIPTILPNKIDESIFDALSEGQQERAKSALREQISVIPRAKGMYWIFSYSNEEIDRYSVNLDTSTCTCYDFMYNCDPEKGMVCKHVWRVRFLLNQNAIPGIEDNPYNWLLLQLEEDRKFLKKNNYDDVYTQIDTLQESLLQDKSWKVDYNWAYRRRAEILNNLDFVTVSLPNRTPLELFED